MKATVLKCKDTNGKRIEATFLPEIGMNLISYKKDDIEVIDQSTRQEFESRFAGLGAMIGPHFHHQKPEWVAHNFPKEKFPHIAVVEAKGIQDPFSHGIGRYAPWDFKATDTTLFATLSGNNLMHGIPLKKLEGCDFTMSYQVELTSTGLHIKQSVRSQRPSLIGLHTYYKLGAQKNYVKAKVQNTYNDMGSFKPLIHNWYNEETNQLYFDLSQEADYGFLPKEGNKGKAILDCQTHQVLLQFTAPDNNLSFQLYHPKGASYACVEPMSARNPRGLETKQSFIQITISITT